MKNNDKNPFLKKKNFDRKIDFLAHSEIFKTAQIYFLPYFQPHCVKNM
jgi:hypothetical protein